MQYVAFWIFQIALVLTLVSTAKAQARKCQWSAEKAWSKFMWGVFVVGFIQLADLYREMFENKGLGILYHIQWIGVYWIALGSYRRKYLREVKRAAGTATL